MNITFINRLLTMFRSTLYARRIVYSMKLSTKVDSREVTPETKRKNALVALSLIGFVVGIYYTAISKMKQGDDLDTIIDQEISKPSGKK